MSENSPAPAPSPAPTDKPAAPAPIGEAAKPATPAPGAKLAVSAAAPKVSAAAARKAGGATEPLPPPPSLQTRRTFMTWGVAAWLVFFGWLGGIGHMFLRFMFPRVLYEKDPKFIAGKKSDYPEVNKVYESYKEKQSTWIVRLIEDGEDHLVALSTTCTHLGCTPNWLEAENKFKCPCHGSGFFKSGINFEGPAPRPLERWRVYVDASGNIIVDRSRKFRKDLAQWTDGDSFVKMS